MNPLMQLRNHGQSYWLDDLTRQMIASGELARRIGSEDLRGVTSNPPIFIQGFRLYPRTACQGARARPFESIAPGYGLAVSELTARVRLCSYSTPADMAPRDQATLRS